MLLPSVLSPYGIYLARIYVNAAVPDEVIESARVDGCPEGRLFARIAVPMMVPGLVTVFLFQFVAVWNNFLLPFIMLSDENKFPLTVGLYTLLNRGVVLARALQPRRHRVAAVHHPADHPVPRAAAVLAHGHRLRSGQAVTGSK